LEHFHSFINSVCKWFLDFSSCMHTCWNINQSPELVLRRVLVLATCRDDITIEKVLSNRTDSNFPFPRGWYNA
jgi:hypothetical protein